MSDNPTVDRLAMSMTLSGARSAIRVVFMMSTDDNLVDAWLRTDGQAGEAVADILAEEMERREIAF